MTFHRPGQGFQTVGEAGDAALMRFGAAPEPWEPDEDELERLPPSTFWQDR